MGAAYRSARILDDEYVNYIVLKFERLRDAKKMLAKQLPKIWHNQKKGKDEFLSQWNYIFSALGLELADKKQVVEVVK